MGKKRQGPRKKVEGYTISAVSEQYGIHPQTLRMYEREGLIKPLRSEGNTRYYTDDDLERLEMILTLTREMGVNLAGVEVILNLREQFSRMQDEMTQFLEAVRAELNERIGDREQMASEALVPSRFSISVFKNSQLRFRNASDDRANPTSRMTSQDQTKGGGSNP